MTDAELMHGIPLFLDQLIKTLEVEQTANPMLSRKVSGPAGGVGHAQSEMGASAALHGRELMQQGFSVDQVVHDYGDLCQAITDLAFERKAPIETDEFRTLNRCLDNGIADAVTEYSYQRYSVLANDGVQALNERLGFLAHELRNLLHTSTLAFTAIKLGNVGASGATGAVLERSLIGLRTLIDRSLADVRVAAGMLPQHELVSVSDFIDQIGISALLEAGARGCKFTVSPVEEGLAVDVDRDMLLSALGNLLQNAFKFTRLGTDVSLSAFAVADRILIEVEDHCGGLPPGSAARIFAPFAQAGADKSGLGLGLAICQRSVEANNGVLRVRDKPGSGCVFTIELPRKTIR
ncbi:MAG TPA: HAMP domain-containing sensor histidine kinase [Steroidobacteraceae bacterium]|nr:HAMP domain-containing sensor histidine kinase [Steroidobacteraceae bacterium]